MPQWPVTKSLKRFLFRIALATLLLVVLVVNVQEGWLSGQTGLFDSLMQADLPELLRRLTLGIIAFDANLFEAGAEHLWFVFSYAIILLWMPLLHVMVKANAKKTLAFLVFFLCCSC